MKTKMSVHSKIASAIVFFTIYLTFVLLLICATPAKATESAQEAKTEQTEQSISDYAEIAPPVTEEQISAFITFIVILFGWITRLIEKRRMKRKIKRELRNSATSKNVAVTEQYFDKTIDSL